MTIEERVEAAQKLIEEVKAELAAKAAPRRNWPEKVEAGMVFRHKRGKVCILTKANDLVWLSAPDDDAVHGGTYGPAKQGFGGKEDCFTYLGHARDILTIRTDAHEPTGAELVGRNIPDGAEWIQEFQGAFYKGVFPNMFVWSSYEDEPKHWCKSIGAHEKYMIPISEWLTARFAR